MYKHLICLKYEDQLETIRQLLHNPEIKEVCITSGNLVVRNRDGRKEVYYASHLSKNILETLFREEISELCSAYGLISCNEIKNSGISLETLAKIISELSIKVQLRNFEDPRKGRYIINSNDLDEYLWRKLYEGNLSRAVRELLK